VADRIVGVLALQGGFAAHAAALQRAGLGARPVRSRGDFAQLAGLILPGGESTTQLTLLRRHDLVQPLCDAVATGLPVLATCAGLILAATTVEHPAQTSFGFLDVAVERNAWGRQLDSFEATDDEGTRPLVFIRAPRIRRVGAEVTVLARHRDEPVLVRQGRVFGATFHPELTAGDGQLFREIFAAAA
jgi:5'-phosphate synthase pdxT subunit